MYTKEELEKLPIPELMEIAADLDVKVSQDDELEHVIYAITQAYTYYKGYK